MSCTKAGILKNYGTINVSGIATACYTPPLDAFEFSGDSLYNNGTILSINVSIYISLYGKNDTSGVISSLNYFKIANVPFFDNFGTIDVSGDVEITNVTFSNYDTINVGNNLRNNTNSFLNNYGCTCYSSYNGVINITNTIVNNSGDIDNNGIINVNGAFAANSFKFGASSCGLLNLTSGGTIQSYNSSELYGNLVIIGSISCFGCTQALSVYITLNPAISCNYATLPIELISFDVIQENEFGKIYWTTESEINNDYFTIERSSDGFNFEYFGTIKGAGNSSSILNYTFYDKEPFNYISYYRLKQTDFDGEYKYSNIVALNFKQNTRFSIYPNPTNGNIVKITSSNFEIKNIKLFNSIGQDFTKNITQIKLDNKEMLIDLSKVKKGIYFITVDNTKFKKIIKN